MSTAPSAAAVDAALGALLPPGVAWAVWVDAPGATDEAVRALGSRERDAVARAVPKRQVEFARGRWCAREALRKARHSGASDAVEIPVGPSREPIWPAGFTGAITHCDGLVAAVAAPLDVVRAIGFDAEVDAPLPPELISQVIAPEELLMEQRGLAEGARDSAGDPILRFSAKESVHKAVFPLTGVWLDFLDVALEMSAVPELRLGRDGRAMDPWRHGVFRARPSRGARKRVEEVGALAGVYARMGGVVVTVSWV